MQFEEKVETEHARFERLSETLKKEHEWFERVYSHEIKRVVTDSLKALMDTEQKVLLLTHLWHAHSSPTQSVVCVCSTKDALFYGGAQVMEAWEQFGPEAKAIA